MLERVRQWYGEKRRRNSLTGGKESDRIKALQDLTAKPLELKVLGTVKSLLKDRSPAVAREAALLLANQRYTGNGELLREGFLAAPDERERLRWLAGINKALVFGLEEEIVRMLGTLSRNPPESCLGNDISNAKLTSSLFAQACNYLKFHQIQDAVRGLLEIWELVQKDKFPVRAFLVAETLLLLEPGKGIPLLESMVVRENCPNIHLLELLHSSGALPKETLRTILMDTSQHLDDRGMNLLLEVADASTTPFLHRFIERLEAMVEGNEALRKARFEHTSSPFFQRCASKGSEIMAVVAKVGTAQDLPKLFTYLEPEFWLARDKRFRAACQRAITTLQTASH